MTNPPADLIDLRHQVMAETGLTDPVEVGIVGDDAHDGGYHIGMATLLDRGRSDDYSIRQQRDKVGGDDASAMDIGDDWPRGGRAGWQRFGILLRQQLGARDPALAAIRALNYLNAQGQKRRFDTLTMVETSSTDSVDIHTHVEWWRNTKGTAGRAQSAVRLIDIVRAARDNKPLSALTAADTDGGIDDMALYQVTGVPPAPNNKDYFGSVIPEFGVMQVTPHGPVNLDAGEWASIAGKSPALIKVTWARLLGRCNAQKPDPIDVETLAQQIADHFPDESVTAATVLAAMQAPEGQAAIASGAVAGLQSASGQAALVEADEYSQDN